MTRVRCNSAGTQLTEVASICGRYGCKMSVQNGMQCHQCKRWYHFKCTGLNEHQYKQLSSSALNFICMSCRFDESQGAALSPSSRTRVKQSVATQKTCDCKCRGVSPSIICPSVSSMANMMEQYQRTLSEMKLELQSLNEYIALALPGVAVTKKAVALSTAHIEEAAEKMKEKALREKRVVLWGRFPTTSSPTELAKSVLASSFSPDVTSLVLASRLRAKTTKKSLGLLVTLPAMLSPQTVVEKSEDLKSTNVHLKGVSFDRSRQERTKREQQTITKSRIMADQKLQLETKVMVSAPAVPTKAYTPVVESGNDVSVVAISTADTPSKDKVAQDTAQMPFFELPTSKAIKRHRRKFFLPRIRNDRGLLGTPPVNQKALHWHTPQTTSISGTVKPCTLPPFKPCIRQTKKSNFPWVRTLKHPPKTRHLARVQGSQVATPKVLVKRPVGTLTYAQAVTTRPQPQRRAIRTTPQFIPSPTPPPFSILGLLSQTLPHTLLSLFSRSQVGK